MPIICISVAGDRNTTQTRLFIKEDFLTLITVVPKRDLVPGLAVCPHSLSPCVGLVVLLLQPSLLQQLRKEWTWFQTALISSFETLEGKSSVLLIALYKIKKSVFGQAWVCALVNRAWKVGSMWWAKQVGCCDWQSQNRWGRKFLRKMGPVTRRRK